MNLPLLIWHPEAIRAIEHNIFTPGNYFYNGVGHVTVKYWRSAGDRIRGNYGEGTGRTGSLQCRAMEIMHRKSHFLEAVILSCQAVMDYAARYAKLAQKMADQTSDPVRKQELASLYAAELQQSTGERCTELL